MFLTPLPLDNFGCISSMFMYLLKDSFDFDVITLVLEGKNTVNMKLDNLPL